MSQGTEHWMQEAVAHALARHAGLVSELAGKGAFRVLEEGGVVLDVYGPGAVLMAYEGQVQPGFDAQAACDAALAALRGIGVRAVYLKPFPRDRSRMGGDMPPEVTSPSPAAGEPLSDTVVIEENGYALETRLYDGWSTGLFLDQRENRRWVAEWARTRVGASVLNTFAYTCAFSVAAGQSGAATTSVDVSPRYLEWGKRNFALNGLAAEVEAGRQRFARMDTFEFFSYARRKSLAYDLIILDPPSFASGNKKKGIRPWSSLSDYARLVGEARQLLRPGGTIFASTNTQELCRGGGLRLEQEILRGLGRKPRWVALPHPPEDFADESGRFAARAFVP